MENNTPNCENSRHCDGFPDYQVGELPVVEYSSIPCTVQDNTGLLGTMGEAMEWVAFWYQLDTSVDYDQAREQVEASLTNFLGNQFLQGCGGARKLQTANGLSGITSDPIDRVLDKCGDNCYIIQGQLTLLGDDENALETIGNQVYESTRDNLSSLSTDDFKLAFLSELPTDATLSPVPPPTSGPTTLFSPTASPTTIDRSFTPNDDQALTSWWILAASLGGSFLLVCLGGLYCWRRRARRTTPVVLEDVEDPEDPKPNDDKSMEMEETKDEEDSLLDTDSADEEPMEPVGTSEDDHTENELALYNATLDTGSGITEVPSVLTAPMSNVQNVKKYT